MDAGADARLEAEAHCGDSLCDSVEYIEKALSGSIESNTQRRSVENENTLIVPILLFPHTTIAILELFYKNNKKKNKNLSNL